MIKNIIKKSFAIIGTAIAFSLISCTDSLEPSNNTGSFFSETNDADSCVVQLSIDSSEAARLALPDITRNDLDSISLVSYNPSTKTTYSFGPWIDVSEMENDRIVVKKGTQVFTLYAYAGSSIYDSTITANVSKKQETLNFCMAYAGNSTVVIGKGNFSIHAAFPLKDGSGTQDVKAVTAGLYYLSGKPVPGYAEEEISFDPTGNATYSKNNVKNGNYSVYFKFYADPEKQIQIGLYQEVVNVSIGLTSKSDISIDSFKTVYPITYNLNNFGTFSPETKVPAFYSVDSPAIELPIPTPISDLYEFNGWYEADSRFGALINEVKYIDPSRAREIKLVSTWTRNIEVKLNGNGGKFKHTENGTTEELEEIPVAFILNEVKNLPPVKNLSLSNPAGMTHFVGWSTNKNATQISVQNGDYVDCGSATFTEDTTLYAIFSSTPAIDDNSDMDNDGLSDKEEINILKTDPNSEDSDGDGWSDKLEKELYNKNTRIFDPCVADVPSFKVTMIGKPSISYTYSTSTGKSESESVSTSEGINHSETHSSSQGTTSSMTHGWQFQVKEGYSWSEKGGFSLEFTEAANGSYSNGSSYTYSQNESETQSKTFSQGKSYTNNTTKSVTGGTVKMHLKVSNNGQIAYTVNNFNVTLFRIASDGLSTRTPLNTVNYSNKFLLEPDQSTDIVVSFTLSSPGAVEDLLTRSSGFYIAPSGYNITMSDGKNQKDFTFDLTKVRAKTARVLINYGVENSSKKEETYLVSTKFKYNPNATSIDNEYYPVTLKDILARVGISEQEGTLSLDNGKIAGIRSVNTKGTRKDGAWFILHLHKSIDGETAKMYNDFSDKSIVDYNLDDIIVSAQDTVHIFYDRDEDEDGVPLSEETINGCSDNKTDSDNDGLTDFEELYGFKRNEITYYTNPMNSDTDGDSDPDEGFNLGDYKDPNPIDPLRKNVARLSSLKFGKNLKSLTEYTGDLKTSTSIELKEAEKRVEYGETLVIQTQAKFLGSRMFWGNANSEGEQAETYTEFENQADIFLKTNGTNYISIKVVAPDGITENYYTIILDSVYNNLSGFTVRSSRAGEANVSWNKYTDSRFEGYLLHVKKANSSNDTYSEVAIDKSIISDAKDPMSNKGNDFFIHLDSDSVLTGMKKITGIASGENYFFALYGYENTSKSPLKYEVLANTNIRMALPEKGTLKLYAHYVEAIEDEDGGYDPDYYWNFISNPSFSSLESFNVSRKSIPEFDDDDDIYYDFATKRNTGESRPDLSYGTVASAQITRENGKEVIISWTCMEADSASRDDNLGTKKISLKYNKDSDNWAVTIDGNIFNGSDDPDRTKKNKSKHATGTLNRDEKTHLCYLYTDSDDGKVKIWLSLEWNWD